MKRRRLRKRSRAWLIAALLILIVILTGVLIVWMFPREQEVKTEEPTLPRISFTAEEREVNFLAGYVDEMDITAMRDTITPLTADGKLTVNVDTDGQEIKGFKYQVYSLNGEETYLTGDAELEGGSQTELALTEGLPDGVSEAVLKITLEIGEKKTKEVYFYTRIEKPDELSLSSCMEFAERFHQEAITKQGGEDLQQYLEPDDTSDNTTLQTVNIHSNLYHIQWGELSPEIVSDVEWSIKESNSVYTSLLARYQISAEGDSGKEDIYNVREFFRVRCSEGEMYLLNYERTMNEVFSGETDVMDEDGILLGVTDSNVQFESNAKGTVVAFVQERELWAYNKKTDKLTRIFSFGNDAGSDARKRYDEHAVRIISMKSDGSTTFAVYGYMNEGVQEGRVGVGIYYYDVEENIVEEKAFIPSTKAFAIAEDELGKMVYFNQENEMLYVLAGGVLYQVNLKSNRQTVLAENLEEGQYVASDDGHLLAYQEDGALNTAKKVKVLNLETEESYEVEAIKEDAVRPLGFVFDDFICGYLHAEDKGTTIAGEEVFPMYEIEIRDTSNKTVKTYSQEGVYISDVLVDRNLITVNRLTWGDGIYTGTSQDYITNNEEHKDSKVSAERFDGKMKEAQIRLTFADGIEKLSPEIVLPDLNVSEKPTTITFAAAEKKTDKYYVYGGGRLDAVYDKAVYAIQKAEQVSGVVISSDQSYIWEKGNRDLVYYTEVESFQKTEEQTSMEACTAFMEQYDAKRINLSGCTLSQILYIINKGLPVIAMTDSSHAILLTGYSTDSVTYIDPDSGAENTVSIDDMNAIAAGSGNTFIGYVR